MDNYELGLLGLLGVGGLALLASTARGGSSFPGGLGVYVLRSQPFPRSGAPGALVHIPPGFDASRPLDICLYWRGWNSCVQVIAGNQMARCRDGGPTKRYSALAEQWDRARVNALLVMPELKIEENSGDPGQLGQTGGVQRFLDELLREHISAAVGRSLSVADVRRLAVASHSGGYQGNAATIARGGVPVSGPIGLFDSLYSNRDVFARAVNQGARLFDLYTESGGTAAQSLSLASDLRATLGNQVVLDTRASDPTPEQWNARVLIKRVPQEHSWVPLHQFEGFVRQCGFDAI